MAAGLLATRENRVLLSLILLKLKCHPSRLILHQQPSRKIQRTTGRGKGGMSVRRGGGRRSENEASMLTEKRGGETSTRGGMIRRTGPSTTAKTSRGGGMILIEIGSTPA
jgi:hypothetical protein